MTQTQGIMSDVEIDIRTPDTRGTNVTSAYFKFAIEILDVYFTE